MLVTKGYFSVVAKKRSNESWEYIDQAGKTVTAVRHQLIKPGTPVADLDPDVQKEMKARGLVQDDSQIIAPALVLTEKVIPPQMVKTSDLTAVQKQ